MTMFPAKTASSVVLLLLAAALLVGTGYAAGRTRGDESTPTDQTTVSETDTQQTGITTQEARSDTTQDVAGVRCAVINLDDFIAFDDTANQRYVWHLRHPADASCVLQQPPVRLLQRDGRVGKTRGFSSQYDQERAYWVYELRYHTSGDAL